MPTCEQEGRRSRTKRDLLIKSYDPNIYQQQKSGSPHKPDQTRNYNSKCD